MLFTEPSAGFDRVLLLAREVFWVPYGGIGFIDARHLWFKARMGFTAPALPREHAFCNDTIKGDDVFFVEVFHDWFTHYVPFNFVKAY